MAKLPYTYTICPPQDAPKQPTASCSEMGLLLKNSPNGDLTINNRMPVWDSWTNRPLAHKSLEEWVHLLCEEQAKEREAKLKEKTNEKHTP